MVTLNDLNYSVVRRLPRVDRMVKTGGINGVDVPTGMYIIADDDNYYLAFAAEDRAYRLLNGTDVYGQGFIIVRKDGNIPTAFWSNGGVRYSQLSTSLKQEVVDAYNETIAGSTVETTETSSQTGSVNERGETIAQQRARERLEEAQANGFDSWKEYQNYLREQEEAIAQGSSESVRKPEDYPDFEGMTKISTLVIREIDEEYISRMVAYADVTTTNSAEIRGNITQKTKEIWNVSTNQYQVDSISYTVGFVTRVINGQDIYEYTDFETQEEAETYFDDYVNRIKEQTDQVTEESLESVAANATEIVTVRESEAYWKPLDISFEDAILRQFGQELDNGEAVFRGLFGGWGPYNDAWQWSDGGNTLELVDFDTPRITTEGVTANPSGALKFTVSYGYKLKLTISSNSRTFTNYSKDEVDGIDGIEVDGSEFEVTMYGGDKLQIDIDNEREGVFPFVITSAGTKWQSYEEIDDELFIHCDSIEQLWYRSEEFEREVYINPPNQGEVKSETLLDEREARYTPNDEWFNNHVRALTDVQDSMTQGMRESTRYDKGIVIGDAGVEDSFVGPEDVTPPNPLEPIGGWFSGLWEDVKEEVGELWESGKWWIIGGVGALVVVGGIFIYINARARQ